MATPDFFGILDKVRRLSPPAGLEAAHRDGFSWARNGLSYGDSTKLTPDDWNRIIANLRAVLLGAGMDLDNFDPKSPLLAREAIKGYIRQAIPDGINEALPIIEAALEEAAATATNAAASAAADAERAEAARDASMVSAQTYPDESTGRAAVADGQSFDVQGSGDVAVRRYRRTNSTTSVLIATFPSKAAVDILTPVARTSRLWRSRALDKTKQFAVSAVNARTGAKLDFQNGPALGGYGVYTKSRLFSRRALDKSQAFAVSVTLRTGATLDFRSFPPLSIGVGGGRSRLFRKRTLDRSRQFATEVRLASGEYLRFDQTAIDGVPVGGGEVAPAPSLEPDWLIPQNFPFSVELATLIPNTVSSWWVTKYWRCGSSQLIGLVMRRTKRRRDGANYYRPGDIVVVEIRDDSPNALVYRIGQQYPLTDCHNADAPTVRPGLKAELGLVVFQSDHASSSDGTYTWMSKNKSPAGLGLPWKTEPDKQGTTYNQAWVRHDRPWERWNLYRGGPSNRWYLMIWDDRQRKVVFRKALFNDSEDQSYFNFWPKPDGSGIRMSWYSNPSSVSVDYRNLMVLDLNYDGFLRNLFGNQVGENIFSTDFTEVDAITAHPTDSTLGPTKVYTPAGTDQVFRQCRLINTRPNDWQVPIVEYDRVIGAGWPQEGECRIRLLNINTAGAAPVTTVKDVCWGGASIHNSNKGYVAGVDLIGHDKVVATRWMPSAPAGQKGQLDIYDVSGSAGFNNWPSLFSVRAEEKIIRPCTSLEIMGDELAVSYRLGPDLMWHQGKPYDPADEDTASGGYETFAKWAMNTVIKNVETLQS